MAAISRVGLTENILKNDRICSRHFITEKPADLLDDTNPDWLPMQNLGHSKSRLHSTAIERWEVRNAKQANRDESLQGTSDSMMTNHSDADHVHDEVTTRMAVRKADASTQIGLKVVQDASTQTNFGVFPMDTTTQTCQNITSLPAFSEDAVLPDDYVRFYTGLPNCKVLKAVFYLIKPALSHHKHCKLTPFQEFIMVLMKLRLNAQMQDLAYRFSISYSTVSRIFSKWMNIMNRRLGHLILWPNRDALTKTMPICFQESFGKKVAVIIDCFEVFLERPSNLHTVKNEVCKAH